MFEACNELVHGFTIRTYQDYNSKRHALFPGLNKGDETYRLHSAWVLKALSIDSKNLFTVNQVHGDTVCVVKNRKPKNDAHLQKADAIVTHLEEFPLGIWTADCVPVLIYDKRLRVLGLVHAGRRGTEINIVRKTLQTLNKEFGCLAKDIALGLGPAIGKCCYEVDEPCLTGFKRSYPYWESLVSPSPSHGRFYLDLLNANAIDAVSFGLQENQIERMPYCTSCDNNMFYSYRRDGNAGRILTVAMIRKKA